MNPTVVLSLISAAGFLTAALILALKKKRLALKAGLVIPLYLALFLYTFIVVSNFLEHTQISSFYDPIEDISEIVFTLIFLFFAHSWRRQKSFEIIQNQETWLSSTLQSIADGVLTTDKDGNVLHINQTMEQFTGWQNKEVFSKPVDTILKFLDKTTQKPIEYNPFKRVLEEGKSIAYPKGTLIAGRDGKSTVVADTTSLIKSPEGNILGAVGIFRDMTEYESLTEQLAHTHKMEAVGQLAGGVAHDLNNMLGGIMGAADVINGRLKKKETRHTIK